MKRQRGRGGGRKPGGHQPNRSFESNGPDVKVRGPAAHIYEKYMQLARDANSAGDRVQAENYLQHAEHYFRVLRAMAPVAPPPHYNDRFGDDGDFDGDEDGGEMGDEPEGQRHEPAHSDQQAPRGDYQRRDQRPRGEFQPRGERGDYQRGPRPDYQQQRNDRSPYQERADYAPRSQPPVEREARDYGDSHDEAAPDGEQPPYAADGRADGEGFRRGRRGRRNRFRPDGERGERPAGENGEAKNVEGFGDAVPAFVGND
jgi:hypothetical protein